MLDEQKEEVTVSTTAIVGLLILMGAAVIALVVGLVRRETADDGDITIIHHDDPSQRQR